MVITLSIYVFIENCADIVKFTHTTTALHTHLRRQYRKMSDGYVKNTLNSHRNVPKKELVTYFFQYIPRI